MTEKKLFVFVVLVIVFPILLVLLLLLNRSNGFNLNFFCSDYYVIKFDYDYQIPDHAALNKYFSDDGWIVDKHNPNKLGYSSSEVNFFRAKRTYDYYGFKINTRLNIYVKWDDYRWDETRRWPNYSDIDWEKPGKVRLDLDSEQNVPQIVYKRFYSVIQQQLEKDLSMALGKDASTSRYCD